MSAWLNERGEDLLLDIVVAPEAARTRIVGEHGDRLKIHIAATGSDRINDVASVFVAEVLGVEKVQVEVVGGHSSTRKTLRVRNVSAHRARIKLSPIYG